MKGSLLIILLSCVFIFKTQLSFCNSNLQKESIQLHYDWDAIPNQVWLGYNFWCNSFLDWKVKDGEVVAAPFLHYKRTAHVTSYEISGSTNQLSLEGKVRITQNLRDTNAYFGFLIGAGSLKLGAKTNNFIMNTSSPEDCHLFAVKNNGEVFIQNNKTNDLIGKIKLTLILFDCLKTEGLNLFIHYHQDKIVFGVRDTSNQFQLIDSINKVAALPKGNIAITYSANESFKEIGYFDDLLIRSPDLKDCFEEKSVVSPILSTFFTNTSDSIFLTAQLMPLKLKSSDKITLNLFNKKVHQTFTGNYDSTAHQVRFRVPFPQNQLELNFRVKYTGNQTEINNSSIGTISIAPRKKPEIMALNCNGMPFFPRDGVDYTTLLYPYRQIEKGYDKIEPDVLVFLGDQIYESRPEMPIYKMPFAKLDYLYKWSIWCYTFRNLTNQQPTIVLTDDHDVYQGNLWGNGGKPAKQTDKDSIPAYYGKTNYDTWQQDNGGYFMPLEFVNLAISSQTSHLPAPFKNKTSMGMINYYTTYQYGDINFCLLEDKKFKSPPSKIEDDIFNGYPVDIHLTPADFKADNVDLLGENQLQMLKKWVQKPSQKNEKRVILTQSAYASLTTVQINYTPLNDQPKRKDSTKQKVAPDMDTNGWPKVGRDRALNTIGNTKVFFLSGDQHMAAVIEVYDTAQNSITFFSVPAIANTWPRMWWPSDESQKNHPLGIYTDAFGNKMKVKAVANPNPNAPEPNKTNYKSPGFGVVKLNRKGNKVKMYAYPLYFDEGPKQYDNWPVKIKL